MCLAITNKNRHFNSLWSGINSYNSQPFAKTNSKQIYKKAPFTKAISFKWHRGTTSSVISGRANKFSPGSTNKSATYSNNTKDAHNPSKNQSQPDPLPRNLAPKRVAGAHSRREMRGRLKRERERESERERERERAGSIRLLRTDEKRERRARRRRRW
jgi:hypothetical protein